MNLDEFYYDLPENLIAQKPLETRENSKLLILNKQSWEINQAFFYNIVDLLWENDVLVLNKTRVINARIYWEIDIFPKWEKKVKKVEIFLHRKISSNTWECLWYPWKNLKIWRKIRFFDDKNQIIMIWNIKSVSEMWRFIEFDKEEEDFLSIIQQIWEIPLPPYIKEKLNDQKRYQTTFNEIPWSCASPTAWLHFSQEILEKLEKKWVKIEKVLLHVWVWTFKPVEEKDIKNHKMHSEYISLDQETSTRLNNYKKNWKNIIAVWTTSIRVLESFSNENWELFYWDKNTDIFIYPWYNWKFVNSLITNFHLPCSTLLMLVSALAWKENIKKSYKYAINNNFRFFSFWDAMRIK